MKIAFFTNTILEHGGGLEKYFIEVASELARRYTDMDIAIVTLNEKRTEMLQRSLSLYYFKDMPISNLYREKTATILEKLGRVRYIKCPSFREVKRELEQYDITYTKNELIDLSILKYFGYKNLPPIIVGAHTPVRIPTVMTSHDRLHNWLYLGFFYRFLLRGTSALHVSNADDQVLLEQYFKHPAVYKIVPPFSVQQNVAIVQQSKSEEFHILYVERLTAQKGIDILMQCIHEFSRRSNKPVFKFRIAGSGETDYEQALRGLARQYFQVEYLGHVPNDEIDALYQWADVVLIPSYVETANYIALEAGANGKIVIVSDLSGPREIIKNKVTGFLVSPVAEEFIRQIEAVSLLKQQNLPAFQLIGEQAKSYITERFAPDAVYPQFRSMFEEHIRS